MRKKKVKKRNLRKLFVEIFLFNFLVLCLLLLFFSFGKGVSLECNINDTSDCTGDFLKVLYLENDSGGNTNAHAQNFTHTGDDYNYVVCCYSENALNRSCDEATVLRLFNFSDSHVQAGNYTGPNSIYNHSVCLSIDSGYIACKPELNQTGDGCLSSGYECLASIASSEDWAGNSTNAHIAPCDVYDMKICCGLDEPSVITNVILNSSSETNYTDENLTVWFTQTDDSSVYTNITDWRLNDRSIAVLNMAFDTNVSSVASDAVRDYSSWGNNGTLGAGTASAMPAWISSGKVGGAYDFDGENDRITADGTEIGDSATFVGWFYVDGFTSQYGSAFGNFKHQSVANGINFIPRSGLIYFCRGDGTSYVFGTHCENSFSSAAVTTGKWIHGALVTNGTNITVYVNGNNIGSTIKVVNNTNTSVEIGRWASSYDDYYFNGTIDEVQIFNRTLTANQIKNMYDAGVENHSVQTIHADETVKHQNWSVILVPNDIYNDGDSASSWNLTIRNSKPVVTLLTPLDASVITNRTNLLNWSATDKDDDSLSYNLTLSAYKLSGAWICNDHRNASQTNVGYVPSTILKCFYDRSYQYNWSVRAYDGEEYGDWASFWRFNLTAIVDISMPVSNISFGNIDLLTYNDTTDESPAPFEIQNDGNAVINISVSSSSLWKSIDNPNNYYKFKINKSDEEDSFIWAQSQTDWGQMPLSPTNTTGISNLNYSNTNDSAIIDIYVEVPANEPPDYKNSTVIFYSLLVE